MPQPKPRAAHLLASPDDVEAQFYEAMREGDLDKLMAVWADDDEIVCVHPGGARVIGARAIRASFEAIFANGGVAVQADQVKRVRSLDAAIHNVVESVLVPSADGMRQACVVATNVFVKTAHGWRIVAHHASPGDAGDSPVADDAPSTLH
jgi:uncharacterized protein (TIGR02246 family)